MPAFTGHTTGHADFPASGSRTRLHAFLRVTPSAVSERFSELLGCPISCPSLPLCVCPEPRPLPSAGITRLHRYYEPLRHPMTPGLLSRATGWSSSPRHKASRVARAFPCVRADANTPAQRLRSSPCSRSPNRISLPRLQDRVDLRIVLFEACSAFTHVAARTLATSPYFVTRWSPEASTVSLPPQLLRLLPAGASRRVGLSPTGKRRLSTAHPQSGRSSPVLKRPM